MNSRFRVVAVALIMGISTQSLMAQCNQALVGRSSIGAGMYMPGDAEMLRRFGISQTDTFTVVTDTSACRRAVDAIAKDAKISAGGFTIVLVRTGSYYVAESDREVRIWGKTFVFDSSMALFLPRDTLSAFSNSYTGPPPTESRCNGPDISRLNKIRFVLTDPRQQWYRDLLGVNGISVDSVHHVADADTCARAIGAIKRYFNWQYEHVQFTLYRVGRFHWAETSWPTAGEWSLVIILDRRAGRVLSQH